MSNSNFRSLQADYVSGINADRNYIKNGLALQGTAGWVSTRRVIEGVTDGTSETFITSSSANPYSFTAGEPLIAFSNLGGLTNGTTYYARDNASDTTLASSVGGAALNLSTLFNTVAVSPNFFGFYSGNSISTWSVTTSAPLRGDSSFLLTKPASLAVGDAHYYPFTIDNADQARVMQLTFDYSVSGTYVTGDVVVRIRDVTNNRIIQPSGFQVENVGVASEARLTFQTSANSTSYELIFNVASVSTAAYTLKIDNIQLSTQVVPLGAPVTDYTSTTPNWTNLGFSSTSINSLIWWRVGPTLFGRAMFRGSGGSGSASALVLAMPSGLTIDTTKVASTDTTEAVGFYKVYDDVGGAATGMGSVDLNSATNLVFRRNDSGTFATSSMTTSDRFTAEFSVPIVGWSSSTVVSSSADTRAVVAAISGNPNSSITTSYTTVTWAAGTNNIDTHGAFNRTTGQFIVPVPGFYQCSANFELSRSSGTATQYLTNAIRNVTKSNTVPLCRNSWLSAGSEAQGASGTAVIYADAGDALAFQVAAQGTSVAWSAAVAGNYVSIELVQGPSQIAASEVIALRTTNGAGTSFTGGAGFADVPFATEVYDTHGAFSTPTFTAPSPGYYDIDFNLFTQGATLTTTQAMQAQFVVTGASSGNYAGYIQYGNGASRGFHLNGAIQIWMNAGDTCKLQFASDVTVSLNTTSNRNYLQVKRLGGVM